MKIWHKLIGDKIWQTLIDKKEEEYFILYIDAAVFR